VLQQLCKHTPRWEASIIDTGRGMHIMIRRFDVGAIVEEAVD
jgi:hypothetical protein